MTLGVLGRWTLGPARAAALAAMPDEATILRPTRVADTSGGFTITYAAVATYPCTVSRSLVRPVEREANPRVQTISAWTITFPAGTDVRTTDRVAFGARVFEVVDAGPGSLEVARAATCLEIT